MGSLSMKGLGALRSERGEGRGAGDGEVGGASGSTLPREERPFKTLCEKDGRSVGIIAEAAFVGSASGIP
ncbi:hypothetical protein GCM10009755_00690 [Brevibacterium samyangense]|uniref:Uncharacterized protein n=1 Tax=Brevibacterium samyangense TaxID=366888 RepID=A0ABP5EFG5_9MICO